MSSVKKAYPKTCLLPTFLAEIEEWDETSDVIVWLFQQKYADQLHSITFQFGELQHEYKTGLVVLEKQTCLIEGYMNESYKKVMYRITAWQEDIDDCCGYLVEVKQMGDNHHWMPAKTFTIKGENRDEFKIVKQL